MMDPIRCIPAIFDVSEPAVLPPSAVQGLPTHNRSGVEAADTICDFPSGFFVTSNALSAARVILPSRVLASRDHELAPALTQGPQVREEDRMEPTAQQMAENRSVSMARAE